MWTLVDTESEEGTFEFRIYGTGHPIDVDYFHEADLDWIDTFQMEPFVWHVFEMGDEE